MNTRLTRADLIALPKAQLHLHLEASIRSTTAAEFAHLYSLPAPKAGPYEGLKGFVEDYESARDLLRSLDDVARIAKETIEDASQQGIVWSEIHCVPFNYGGRLGPAEGIVEAVLDGIAIGCRDTGVSAGLILAHNRAHDHSYAWQALEIAKAFKNRGVSGFGLVGNEADFPPSLYADMFTEALRHGFLSLPHAGEADGPESVRSAWRDLGAHRINHGIRAVEDATLLNELAQAQICLDVCMTSNVMLQASKSIEEHQLKKLIAAGVPVSLGSDGPLFFKVDVVDEYLNANRFLGINRAGLAKIAHDSIHHSAAPESIKDASLSKIEAWLSGWNWNDAKNSIDLRGGYGAKL